MKNLGAMMKQAQQMQEKMSEMQEMLAQQEVTGASGGGMVTITLTGKSEIRQVKIDPSLVNGNDIEMLEDLIAAAFSDAKGKADALMSEKMAELSGGLQLPPGFKMPF